MVEDLMDYLVEYGVCVCYLYLDIDIVEWVEIIWDLCLGEFDVLVGINLLCEGLDMLEVFLVVILDVDKEGFLCFECFLIQIIGCVVWNLNGWVIFYVDKIINFMCKVMDEIECCRNKQMEFNKVNGIIFVGIRKFVEDIMEGVCVSGGNCKNLWKVVDWSGEYKVDIVLMELCQVVVMIKEFE